MSKIQVDPALLLALIRCFKEHKPIEAIGTEERKIWIGAHQLECVAEGKVAKARKAKSPD